MSSLGLYEDYFLRRIHREKLLISTPIQLP